jgi:hypothetical protein
MKTALKIVFVSLLAVSSVSPDKGRIRVQEGNPRAGTGKGRRNSVSGHRESVDHRGEARRAQRHLRDSRAPQEPGA